MVVVAVVVTSGRGGRQGNKKKKKEIFHRDTSFQTHDPYKSFAPFLRANYVMENTPSHTHTHTYI